MYVELECVPSKLHQDIFSKSITKHKTNREKHQMDNSTLHEKYLPDRKQITQAVWNGCSTQAHKIFTVSLEAEGQRFSSRS